MQRDRQMAMILVTHDLGVVAGRAHDIAVMYAGQIVESAPAADLFARVRHPYTEALLESIPKLEMAKHTRLNAIGGRPPDLVNLPSGCKFAPRCPYAQDKCREEEPHLLPDPEDPAHLVRCFFPVSTVATDLAAAAPVSPGDKAEALHDALEAADEPVVPEEPSTLPEEGS
jgi:oligopeptide/dipeptide ABC transporter ATP-binding protein